MEIDGVGKLVCPICKSTELEKIQYPGNTAPFDTLFRCKSVIKHEGLAFCKGCKKLYPYSGFGKHGDNYECKECGRVQWDYTELENKLSEGRRNAMRTANDIEAFLRALRQRR